MKIKKLFGEVYHIWVTERPALLAAALAYYGMFSLAPAIYIAFQVAGMFIDQSYAVDQLFSQVQIVLGLETTNQIRRLVNEVSTSNHSGSFLISVVGFFAIYFAASGFFFQIEYTLNQIWRVPPTRRHTRVVLEKRIWSFVMVVGVSALIVAATLLNVALTWFKALIDDWIPLGNWSYAITAVTTFVILSISFALLYKLLPEVKIAWGDVWPGAMISSFLILLAGSLATIYLKIGTFGSAFKVAGAFAVILLSIYYIAQIFLLGAVITRVYSSRNGSRRDIGPGHLGSG
jgi:membrane protein